MAAITPVCSDSEIGNLCSIPTDDLISYVDKIDAEKLMDMENFSNANEDFNINLQHQHNPNVLPAVQATAENNNQLPRLEEFGGEYNFAVNLPPQSSEKRWLYSEPLQKIYVKFGQPLYVLLAYENKRKEPLFLRAMLVPTSPENAKDKLIVCPNHQQKASYPEHHILRCKMGNCEYQGIEDGYYTNNRLSVVVPLWNVAPNEPIHFEFHCQNSCPGGINRKSTSVIFTLENVQRQVLGQQVKHVKICSCPKRDKEKEEKGLPKKRKTEGLPSKYGPPGKIPKIKQELSPTQTQELTGIRFCNKDNSIAYDPVTLGPIDIPNRVIAVEVLTAAYNTIAGRLQNTDDPYMREQLLMSQAQIQQQKNILLN